MPKLGNKSMRQMRKKPRTEKISEKKIPQDRSPKICSTLDCPRCHAQQSYWRATCFRCGACFYCGLVGGNAFQCHLCGNHVPKEDRNPPADRAIRLS